MNAVLPLALASGINLYLTFLVVGLSIRFGWVDTAPANLHALSTLPVLIVAGIFYILEFFADKIAFVDNVWDLIHTFIRPIGAVAIATASLSGVDPGIVDATSTVTGVDPGTGLFAAVIAGLVALTAHGGKAGTRTVVNVASPAETFSNIIISLIEDVVVALMAFLALRYPLTANGISIIILAVIVVFVPQLLRWAWFTLGALLARLRGVVHQVRQPDQLPAEYAALLNTQHSDFASRCRAQNIRLANGRRGYLVLVDGDLAFTYSAWFRRRVWQITQSRILSVAVLRRVLVDVLEVHYHDERQKPATVRFVFTKDRKLLVERFAQRLGGSLPADGLPTRASPRTRIPG